MNGHGLKSIEYSHSTAEIILKKEDKFVYAQAIMNLYLSTARIYSKIFEKDESKALLNLESSYREYLWLSKFMGDFMKDKGISDPKELAVGMREPYQMMMEMVELLPVKISKLNAKIKK